MNQIRRIFSFLLLTLSLFPLNAMQLLSTSSFEEERRVTPLVPLTRARIPFYFRVAPDYKRADRPRKAGHLRLDDCYSAHYSWALHSSKIKAFCQNYPERGHDVSTAITVPLEEEECRFIETYFSLLSHDELLRSLLLSDIPLTELIRLADYAVRLAITDLYKPCANALAQKLIKVEINDCQFSFSAEVQLFFENSGYLDQLGLSSEIRGALSAFLLSKADNDTVKKMLAQLAFCGQYSEEVLMRLVVSCNFEQKLMLKILIKIYRLLEDPRAIKIYNHLAPQLKDYIKQPSSELAQLLARPHARALINSLDKRILMPLLVGDEHLIPDQTGAFIIQSAARQADLTALRYLLWIDCPLELRDNESATALHHAAESGHNEIVSLLLTHGADYSAKDARGATPLDRALEKRLFETVLLLINHQLKKTDSDRVNNNETLLHLAAQINHCGVANAVLETGAELFARNRWGETPLFQAATLGNEDMVHLLIEYAHKKFAPKKAIHQAAANGQTPLHAAAHKGTHQTVQFLCESGADLNACTSKKETALHFAMRRACSAFPSTPADCDLTADTNLLDVVKLLLSLKADVNAQNCEDVTPLAIAAEYNNLPLTELLLSFHARLDLPDRYQRTIIHRAAMKRSVGLLSLFYRLVGEQVHRADALGNTPLHYAAENDDAEVMATVKLLIGIGASCKACNKLNQIPAHSAFLKNKREIAHFLLMKEVEGLECALGWTPAHCAAFLGYTALLDYMLLQPALKNVMSDKQWTLLHAAALGGSIKTVMLLIDAGLNKSAVTADGKTSYAIAKEKGHADCAQLLAE